MSEVTRRLIKVVCSHFMVGEYDAAGTLVNETFVEARPGEPFQVVLYAPFTASLEAVVTGIAKGINPPPDEKPKKPRSPSR